MILAPFGFYGAGNIGDEATLMGFGCLVRASGRQVNVVVASMNPRHTHRVEPYFRYHQYEGAIRGIRPRIDAHLAQSYVFPGGTPIQDSLGGWPLETLAPMVQHAHRWGKPAVFVGVGTEKLRRPESKVIVRECIAPFVAHWSVRSEPDQDRLLDLDVPANRITVAADMAWLMPRADLEFGRHALAGLLDDGRPLIGVNVNAEVSVLERAPRFMEDLAGILDEIIDTHNARVIFLCNEVREGPTYDRAAGERVKLLMRRADSAVLMPNDYHSPQQMMSIIGHCALTVSTRIHFCLFSALQGTPFLAIKRSDKVADLCADLNWEFGTTVEAMAEKKILSQAHTLLADPKPALERLYAHVQEMKARSQANVKALDVLLASPTQIHGAGWLKRAFGRAFSGS